HVILLMVGVETDIILNRRERCVRCHSEPPGSLHRRAIGVKLVPLYGSRSTVSKRRVILRERPLCERLRPDMASRAKASLLTASTLPAVFRRRSAPPRPPIG